jgi:hypothetical protein
MNPKSILVYSSIGDVSTFFPLWKQDGIHYAFNYYGQDEVRKELIKKECDFFTHTPGTKFNLFSKLYDSLPVFDYYVVIDDDINLMGKDIVRIVNTMTDEDCGVASPSHSNEGRISWPIMETRNDSDTRESNFVEMTAVIFSREELEKFMLSYIPYRDRMVGWGVDHIIHSVCRKPFLIFDSISVINPTNQQKKIAKREIINYLAGRNGEKLWKSVLADSNNSFVEYRR